MLLKWSVRPRVRVSSCDALKPTLLKQTCICRTVRPLVGQKQSQSILYGRRGVFSPPTGSAKLKIWSWYDILVQTSDIILHKNITLIYICHSVIVTFYFSLQLYNKGKLPILDTERLVRCPQVTVSHPPGGKLPLLSARPAVIFSAAENHRPVAGTKLYCLVTEEHRCEQLA